MNKFKNAVVITGSIGSGKSTASAWLKSQGYVVVDADDIAHEALNSCINQISAKFHNVVKNGVINRAKLGEIVFSDAQNLAWLENLLHPKIRDKIFNECMLLESKNELYFVDIPLYFEKINTYSMLDKVAVIYAPKHELIKRIMSRNCLNLQEATRRVELQIDIEIKKQKATFVIDNSSDINNLHKNLKAFLHSIVN